MQSGAGSGLRVLSSADQSGLQPHPGHTVRARPLVVPSPAVVTSGLLLFTAANVFQYSSEPCINCGSCVRACPMQLNPAYISRAVEANDIAMAESFGVMNCLECGACSFSCPAYRDVTQFCRRAKASIRAAAAAAKAKAAAANPAK